MAQQAIVGEKVGMTQTWVDDKVVPVTVVRVDPMRIVQIKTSERDGYTALQVTYGHREAKKLNKQPLNPVEGKIYVQILIDRPMIEIFGGHGRTISTQGFKNDLNLESVSVFCEGGEAKLISLEVNELDVSWK